METAILAGIMGAALLEGPPAMDVVNIEGDFPGLNQEMDRFTIGLAAYREALVAEQAERDSLESLHHYQRTFRSIQRRRVTGETVGELRRAYYELAMLLRGVDEEKRTRAADRVRHAMSALFAPPSTIPMRFFGDGASPVTLPTTPIKVTPQTHPALYLPIDVLELGVRAENCLRDLGVRYIGELVVLRKVDLLQRRNFGRSSLADIESQLKQQFDLRLDMKLEGFDRAEAERSGRQSGGGVLIG